MNIVENNFRTGKLELTVGKTDQINVRVKPDLKDDLDRIAEYRGLTVSSYVHSVLTAKVREEREALPQLFKQPGQVVGRIEPGIKTPEEIQAEEIRRQLQEGNGLEMASSSKKTIPLMNPKDLQKPQKTKRKA